MKLSFWEEFLVSAVVSLLTVLQGKIKNPTELAALEAALAFLQKLNAGNVQVGVQ